MCEIYILATNLLPKETLYKCKLGTLQQRCQW